MKKSEKVAIAAVIAYMDWQNQAADFMKMKKKAYENYFSKASPAWNENGIRNIITGRKILDAKTRLD
ncbi:MAG: hypothetical protein RBR53_05120 [Desulforegulaceae bacterium]|nr:hypothetical protein [Desulforegulaceae bacterium]